MRLKSRTIVPVVMIVTLLVLAPVLIVALRMPSEIVTAFTAPIVVLFAAELIRLRASEQERELEVARYASLLFDEIFNHHRSSRRFLKSILEWEESPEHKTQEYVFPDGSKIQWEVKPRAPLEEFSNEILKRGIQSGLVERMRDLLPSVIVSNLITYYAFLGDLNSRIRHRKHLMESSIHDQDDYRAAIAFKATDLHEQFLKRQLLDVENDRLLLCRDLQLFFQEYGVGGQVIIFDPDRREEFARLWEKDEHERQEWYLRRGVKPPPTFPDKDTSYLWEDLREKKGGLGLDVAREDEIWHKNIVYDWDQKGNLIYFASISLSAVIISLVAFVLTMKAVALLGIPIGIGGGLSIYFRLLIVPVSVGVSSFGLRFRYGIGEPVKTYPWTDIQEIWFRNAKGDPLMPYKWKIVRIRVRRGKHSRIGVNISDEIYEFIREASKKHSPNTTWVDTSR